MAALQRLAYSAAFALLALGCTADDSPDPTNGSGGSTASGDGSGGMSGGMAGKGTGGSTSSMNGSGGAAGSAAASGGRSGSGSGGVSAGGSGGMSAAGSGGAGSGGSTAGSGGTNGTGDSDFLEPAQGALLGMFYGDADIAATSAKLGRALPVHLTYYAWDDDWTQAGTKADLAANRIPLVNWEPYSTTLDAIISGSFDDMLDERASDAKALGKKLFLDFAAEMNGDWSPWSGADNGMSADKYIAAYRHIHDVMTDGGATNIVWLWCPNVTDEPGSAWNETLNYYPGDAYVDWTCVDGYNWGSTNGGWQSFDQVFSDIYEKLATKNKPIMIGEMASTEDGGDKAAWIDAMIPALRDDFPLIKGVIWFDIDKETDWRISSSDEAEAAFKKMANDAYFNP